MAYFSVLVFLPLQEAKYQEQRIGAAFLKAHFRSPIDLQQVAFQLVFWEVDNNLPSAQCISRHGVHGRLTISRCVHGCLSVVATGHYLRHRANAEFLRFCDSVFQRSRVGANDAQARFRRFEVQQSVAQREVEQLAFPAR